MIHIPRLNHPVRLAVLLSGSGTTLENLLDRSADGRLRASVRVVIASKSNAYGLERARQAGVPHAVVERKALPDADRFNDALHAELAHHEFDLIVMAGFLSPIQLRGRYTHRAMNIHPALIPAFSGKGFYGARVHEAAIAAGVKLSGCTVHFADDEYDHGPIILQGSVPVLDDDDASQLAARVHGVENELYPQAIQLWGDGRLAIDGRRVRILP